MEADLRRFFHVSRHDLGLIELLDLARHLPREAVLMDNDGWSLTDELISDLIFVHSGKHHPGDPRLKREQQAKEARLGRASARSTARRTRLGIKGSVLRRKPST